MVIHRKAKAIALAQKDNSFFLVKFTDETTLKGLESNKKFKVGEAIIVNYSTKAGENIATSHGTDEVEACRDPKRQIYCCALQNRWVGRDWLPNAVKEEGCAVKFLNVECECYTSGEYQIW